MPQTMPQGQISRYLSLRTGDFPGLSQSFFETNPAGDRQRAQIALLPPTGPLRGPAGDSGYLYVSELRHPTNFSESLTTSSITAASHETRSSRKPWQIMFHRVCAWTLTELSKIAASRQKPLDHTPSQDHLGSTLILIPCLGRNVDHAVGSIRWPSTRRRRKR